MGEGTRVNRGIDEHRREAARRLLPLLTAEERTCLRAELKVAEATTPEVDLDAILEALSRLPRYRALALLLELAEPLASMLRDVARFLEHHGVAARTTGFILGLPHAGGDVELSPQVVGLVCSWPHRRLRSLGDDPFAELLRDWRWLRPGWDALAERARVRVDRGEIDLVETVIERKLRAARGEPPDPEPRRERERDLTDQDARAVAVGLLGRVEATAAVLRRIPAEDRTASGRALIKTLTAALAETRRALALDDLTAKPRAMRNAERTVALYRRQRFPKPGFFDNLDRFEEDVRSLASLAEADAYLDALRADIWSSRPQLFEVWVLASILGWLERRGYAVELLKLEGTRPPSPRTVWQLKYAKDSSPCARVTGKGQEAFVFYQLYQARDAGRGGAMPDLALLRGDHAGAERVWAVDPKLSTTYGPAEYASTARRYVQDFGAPVAVVVEHFRRLAPNPQPLCDGGSLVTDVGPAGAGFRHLVAALAPMHPPVSLTVLCVDLSASFDARRAEALRAIAGKLDADLEAVADEYVCFAGDAATASGLHDFLRSHDGRPLPAPRLGEGTAIGPLLDELRALADRLGPVRIELVGDGGFDDPDWQARIAGELGAELRVHG